MQGATNVITETFTLRTITLLSLIGIISTHSYVLSELACELGILVEMIDKGVTITSSIGDSVLVNKVYRRCLLMIQGQVFYANLMELPYYGFNVILGMDCVIEHKTIIDFELKGVNICLTWSRHKITP